jgi:hypothetical protein
LRTPLANLRNIADMFETDYLTKEEVHWLMKDINPMVKGAELTLSNLLEWAGNQMKGQSISLAQLIFSSSVSKWNKHLVTPCKKRV